MNQTRVKMKITAKGDTELEVNGVSGVSCEDVTKALTDGLGEIVEQNFTSEYYEQEELPDTIESHEGDCE